MTYLISDDMISCLPVYNYAVFFFLAFSCLFQSLFFWKILKKVYNIQNNRLCFHDMKSVTQAWLNTRKQLVLTDSLFTRNQPSLRDRFFISWKHNLLFSMYYTIYTTRKLCLWVGILFSRCPSVGPSVCVCP